MQHAPIGARDLSTLAQLQEKGIPSYFSGCLTLTLNHPVKHRRRRKVIYAVDVSQEVIDYIRSKTGCKVIPFSHLVPASIMHNNEARLAYARRILRNYGRATCVVTTRLHATMPCLALETPVLLISDHHHFGRLSGLRELARSCSSEELISGEYEYDFNTPPKNPDDYLPIRERLIEIMTDWVQSH